MSTTRSSMIVFKRVNFNLLNKRKENKINFDVGCKVDDQFLEIPSMQNQSSYYFQTKKNRKQ